MRNHRRRKRATVAIPSNSKASYVMPAPIGASGTGQPKLTIEAIREGREKRAETRAMRAIDNSLMDLRAPIATSSVSDFDYNRGAGYLCSRSIKNSRMSKGAKLDIRLSSTRNPNAQARPTGGIFKGAPNSERRIERNW